jgi:hypothetical protein
LTLVSEQRQADFQLPCLFKVGVSQLRACEVRAVVAKFEFCRSPTSNLLCKCHLERAACFSISILPTSWWLWVRTTGAYVHRRAHNVAASLQLRHWKPAWQIQVDPAVGSLCQVVESSCHEVPCIQSLSTTLHGQGNGCKAYMCWEYSQCFHLHSCSKADRQKEQATTDHWHPYTCPSQADTESKPNTTLESFPGLSCTAAAPVGSTHAPGGPYMRMRLNWRRPVCVNTPPAAAAPAPLGCGVANRT